MNDDQTNHPIQTGTLNRPGYHDFSNRVCSPEGIARTIMGSGGNNNDKAGQYLVGKPEVIGGIGEKKSNGGKQYYQQDRIYDGENTAISVTTSFNPYYTDNELRIRKITPKECFRLMGFSDDDFSKAEAVCSNTQLYKQAGNSIVVDVLEELFCSIIDSNKELLE